MVASVSWIYQLKSRGLHVPFLPRFNEKINDCNIMRKTCYSDRCSPYVVSDWDLGDDLNCAAENTLPPGSVQLLNAPSSIFAGGIFQLLSLDEIHQSCRSESSLFHLFWIEGEKTSGLLWFPSNLDCMNAISRAVRRYFRSSSWNLAQILFSGYH